MTCAGHIDIHTDLCASCRGERSAAHSNWMPDFDYLTREATMVKVFEKAGAE